MHHVIRMTLMQIRECIRMEFRSLLHKYQLLVINSYTAVLRFAAQPASGNNLLLVSAAARQLSAAGATGTKQQYSGCNPQEVVRVEPAGETDFLRGALEPHTPGHHVP